MRGAVVAAAGLAGAAVTYKGVVEPWWKRWGVDAELSSRALPGDELVPGARTTETRVLDVAAPPSVIWPWLVQMGFGRGGWYSYDVVDMAGSSSDVIDPGLQRLDVGDIVPTHPGGGFVVRVVDAERALVLYSDTELVERQARVARESGTPEAPVNVRASGAFLGGSQPSVFAASWAFVLEPVEPGRTRLIERFRVRYGDAGPLTSVTLPLLGFGVFVMMRRQMLGIRERAERTARPAVQQVAVA